MTTTSGISPSPVTRASVYQTVASGATGRQTQLAVRLASNAGILASFGAHGTPVQTYNAVGMLNLLTQTAGHYQALAASKPPTPATATPTAPVNGADVAGNWARLLQARPGMAFTAAAYLTNQGIVASL
jgi:hypothetical protein